MEIRRVWIPLYRGVHISYKTRGFVPGYQGESTWRSSDGAEEKNNRDDRILFIDRRIGFIHQISRTISPPIKIISCVELHYNQRMLSLSPPLSLSLCLSPSVFLFIPFCLLIDSLLAVVYPSLASRATSRGAVPQDEAGN